MTSVRLFLSAVVVGLIAGVLLDVATFLVARYGPAADGWSFRGNGALVVPFGEGPVILTGAWTGLVARYRGFDRWLLLGIAAGLLGTGFVLISVFALVLFNASGVGVSNAITFFILGWMVVAPVLAGFVRAPAGTIRRGQLGGHIMAGAVFAIALFAAFTAASLVLAPGS